MSAGLSGMAEGSAEFFYRAHFRAQRNIVLNKFRRQRNVQRHRASQKSH